MKPKTVREAYLQASSFLRRRNVSDAGRCAELLLQHALGVSRSELFLRWEEPLPSQVQRRWRRLVARKALGEPVQYITGEQYFYGLPFAVGPEVLIPRPETELLVEEAIRRGRELFAARRPVVVDVGTGSGAIAVAMAACCPDWNIIATDISAAALAAARRNAARNGVERRIAFLRGDLLFPLIERRIAVDALVANPPYVRTADIAGLQREVTCFEPHLALDGGPDGLNVYRAIVEQLPRLEKYPRFIGFEVGCGQAEAVREMLSACGAWDDLYIVNDLAGIGRHVIGWKKKS